MPRVATFKEYYSLLTTGVGGDENVRAFNEAMDSESNLCDAVKAFNNAHGIILAGGPDKKVKIIHGLMNTISHLTSKVCGHIGLGDTAFIGHLNYVKALLNIQFDTPTTNKFTACTTKEDLQGLQRPGAASLGDTYDGTAIFFLIPLAQRAVIECQSTCPIDRPSRNSSTHWIQGILTSLLNSRFT